MNPEITNVHVSDSRKVRADVTGMPELRTTKGTRPIAPKWIDIRYRIGSDDVYVEISGRKLFEERTRYNNSNTVRRFGPGDVLPDWAAELVEEHRPITTREGWWR